MLIRLALGLPIAAVIAWSAWRARSLSSSGAVAATFVGAACVSAGWSWGVLLVAYFVVVVASSHLGRQEKERRVGAMLAKGTSRDAMQVVANGGIYTGAALIAGSLTPSPFALIWGAAAAGALAASAADTLATEIGMLYGGVPRSVRTLRPVAHGTSGAVSIVGTVALVMGSLFVAMGARWLGAADAILPVTLGGVAGTAVDTLLGATLQERRWCPRCEMPTERRVHDCSTATTLIGGMSWVTNDVVNLMATMVGAGVAAMLAAI